LDLDVFEGGVERLVAGEVGEQFEVAGGGEGGFGEWGVGRGGERLEVSGFVEPAGGEHLPGSGVDAFVEVVFGPVGGEPEGGVAGGEGVVVPLGLVL